MQKIIKNQKLSDTLKLAYQNGLTPHNKGIPHTDEAKLKMSIKARGRKLTEIHKRNISKGGTGLIKTSQRKREFEKFIKNEPLVFQIVSAYIFSKDSVKYIAIHFNIPYSFVSKILNIYNIKIEHNTVRTIGRKGTPMRKEIKEKFSKLRKGIPLVKNHKKVINLQTNEVYESLSEAANKLNTYVSTISNVVNKKVKSWKYKLEFFKNE